MQFSPALVANIAAYGDTKYSPSQPRAPRGTSNGGQWIDTGVDIGRGTARPNRPRFSLISSARAADIRPQSPSSSRRSTAGKPNHHLSISENGASKIRLREEVAFQPRPYRDHIGKRLTIGYGHLIKPGEDFSQGITEATARQLFIEDLATAEAAIRRNVKVPLSQNQFDALVSLVYNIGQGNFAKSSLLKHLNRGDFTAAVAAFQDYVYVRSSETRQPVRTRGLSIRRAAERAQFLGLPE